MASKMNWNRGPQRSEWSIANNAIDRAEKPKKLRKKPRRQHQKASKNTPSKVPIQLDCGHTVMIKEQYKESLLAKITAGRAGCYKCKPPYVSISQMAEITGADKDLLEKLGAVRQWKVNRTTDEGNLYHEQCMSQILKGKEAGYDPNEVVANLIWNAEFQQATKHIR